MKFSANWGAAALSETIELPCREITDAEMRGGGFGAQRFRGDELYEAFIGTLIEKAKKRKTQSAEIQVLRIGAVFYAGVPAEFFVEFRISIKEKCYPFYALTAGGANGMVGYVPTKEAFSRGGMRQPSAR